MKIITVLGTRPEIIRLSLSIDCFDKYFDHIIVHTGQNYDYELNEIFFKQLGIRQPDYFLSSAGNTASETIANVITRIESVLINERPDAIVILGDTNSCLAAIPAKRNKIPIFHIEAGNRCFDMRVPEEINRKIVDHISDINVCYSKIAKDNLMREGLRPDMCFVLGSPLKEVFNTHLNAILKSEILTKLGLEEYSYVLVSFHREENVDSAPNLQRFLTVLSNISNSCMLPIIVSTHPRTQKALKNIKDYEINGVVFSKPLGFYDYCKLQICSKVVLSDSGSISEESSILNFPALNLRTTNERQESFEEGSVMMVGLDEERIKTAMQILDSQKRHKERTLRIVENYNVDNFSEKMTRLVLSYVAYVNEKVWVKSSQTND